MDYCCILDEMMSITWSAWSILGNAYLNLYYVDYMMYVT